MNEQKKRLQKIIHEVIADCCLREVQIVTWLVKPYDVEQKLIDALLPANLNLPEAHELSGEEALRKLSKLVPQFKDLMRIAEEAQKGATLLDVQLDVVQCKAKLEILEWVAGLELPDNSAAEVFIKSEEIKKQLELLEGVVANAHS